MTEPGRSTFQFRCPACRVRLEAHDAHVGRRIKCPKCKSPSVVPERHEAIPPPATLESDDSYEVWQGEGLPPASRMTYLPIDCRVCGTHFYGTPDQIGQELKCPDCYAKNILAPPAEPTERKPVIEVGDPYHVQDGATSATPSVVLPAAVSKRRYVAPAATGAPADEAEVHELIRVRPDPPRWPLVLGIVGYPFYPTVYTWLVGLSVTAVILQYMILMAIDLSDQQWLAAGSVVLVTMASMFSAIWVTAMASCLANIVQSSSDGESRLRDPDVLIWLDRFSDVGYLLCAAVYSLLPGLAAAQFVSLGHPIFWLISISAGLVIFPLALLSAMEANSIAMPYSRPVWRTLIYVGWAWLFFYLQSALLALLGCWLFLALPTGGLWGYAPQVAFAIFLSFLYFRLLGRLAYLCAEHSPELGDDEKEESDAL